MQDDNSSAQPQRSALRSIAARVRARLLRGLGLARSGRGEASGGVTGYCEGVDGGRIHGWAWRPSAPDERVEVELWVDGALLGKALADQMRSDLKSGGIGDGRHAWRLRLQLDHAIAEPQQVEVRAGGGVLRNGAFKLTYSPDLQAADARRGSTLIAASEDIAVGICDGVEGGELQGWAWRPAWPEVHVEIEQFVDGVLKAAAIADAPRPDLQKLKMGHGRYGWRMPLALDRAKAEPQQIEVRIKGGPALKNGRFALSYDPKDGAGASPEDAASVSRMPPGVVGHYDGLKGSALHGWAWNPDAPDEPAEVELWVDGAKVREATANGFRPDLRAQRIGHGRYGWRLPIELDPLSKAPLKIEVRAKHGAPLADGVFELKSNYSLHDPANLQLRPFINAVFDPASKRVRIPPRPNARWRFLFYCPPPTPAGVYWAQEYDDYRSAMNAFATVLRSLGDVTEVADEEEAISSCRAKAEEGAACVLFSFGPPRLAPLTAGCAVVPVFSWAFPSLPSGQTDGDPRSDWRNVLRQTGRAITFSSFAAETVRAALGADYPVISAPPPLAERFASAPAPSVSLREIAVRGVIFDSREQVFDPDSRSVPSPLWRPLDAEGKQRLTLEGVVLVAALEFADGRRNWKDLVSAFAIANQDNADATLIVLLEAPVADWWRELYKWTAVLPSFKCRIIGWRAEMDEAGRQALIAASHWHVSASKAEGVSIWMQQFLSAGRPAVAPLHTAFRDYLASSDALVVASDEEAWSWPDAAEDEGWSWTQHPDDVGLTTRHRISWADLSAKLGEAARLPLSDPGRYANLCAAAKAAMQAVCGEDVIAARLDAFLGLGQGLGEPAASPSQLLELSAP